MMELWLVLLLLGALVAVSATIGQREERRREQWAEGIFDSVHLQFSEQLFRSELHGLVGKPDRVYVVDDVATLVDFKTRGRHVVFPSDIVELSTQRLAVEAQIGKKVARSAYVVTEAPDRTRMRHVISLLDHTEILAIKERRRSILEGLEPARRAHRTGICRHCAYQKECNELGSSAGERC